MTLENTIKRDLVEALKGHEKVHVSVLRLLLSEIKNVSIARKASLDDSEVVDVIARGVRRHHESIEAFKRGSRGDLVDQEEAELNILVQYLPKQMSREEIEAAARHIIALMGSVGMRDKGRVMSQLMPQLRGKASGQEVSDVVSGLLASM